MPKYGQYFIAVRLMLLKRFLETNAGRNRIITRRQMEDYLESQGYQVEKKTLYTDLDYLQARFGLKLEYDPHKKGYRLLNPPFEPHELRLIVDGIQSSKFITAEKARELSAKVRNLAREEVRKELNHTSHVSDRVRSMNESVVNEADRIHQAIAGDFKIGSRYFHYTPSPDGKKNYSKSGNQYIVSPYALLWNNSNYYLYAYDSESKKFRYFRVDRMERISEPLPYHRDGKDEYSEKKLTRQKVKVLRKGAMLVRLLEQPQQFIIGISLLDGFFVREPGHLDICPTFPATPIQKGSEHTSVSRNGIVRQPGVLHGKNHLFQLLLCQITKGLLDVQMLGNAVKVELVVADGCLCQTVRSLGKNKLAPNLFNRLFRLSNHLDFSCHNETSCLSSKVVERHEV